MDKKQIKGWVYVITDPAMPELVKVGFSTKDPILRAEEFNGTGHPYAYEVAYEVLVFQPFEVEQAVHRALKDKREGREWFRCSSREAIAAIKDVVNCSHLYESPNDLSTTGDADKTKKHLPPDVRIDGVGQLAIAKLSTAQIRTFRDLATTPDAELEVLLGDDREQKSAVLKAKREFRSSYPDFYKTERSEGTFEASPTDWVSSLPPLPSCEIPSDDTINAILRDMQQNGWVIKYDGIKREISKGDIATVCYTRQDLVRFWNEKGRLN